MAEQDASNYSSSSSHRLPTVSASQALQNLTSSRSKAISTGLKRLDALLQGREPTLSSQDYLPGGLSRSQVTEIYGPPGVGKTVFWYVIYMYLHTLGIHLIVQLLPATASIMKSFKSKFFAF
ncbi:MAG: hypothetical protein LQ347_005524 [Umbilicaria vellea]|nr:MAG: hypothetical protein LQ347_005524 [Umbilicaria vellea]